MKKRTIYYVVTFVLFVMNISCIDDTLREDLDNLKYELDNQKNEIDLLKESKTVNFIENLDYGYKIHFSDDTFVEISNGKNGVNGTDGLDGINGTNGKDGVNGVNGQDGVNGANGKDGVNGANGQNGISAPYIVEILENDTHFIFKFSDNSKIESPINLKIKRIACWGDSLTAQGFPTILQGILGSNEYGVLNLGVGGENSLTIAARQGGIPMFLKNKIEIPGTTETVIIGDKSNSFQTTHGNATIITPLLQGGNLSINNCIINDIECVIRWSGNSWNDPNGRYTLTRTEVGVARTTTENSIVYTGAMKKHRNFHANIFFVGQNGGWTSYEDLTSQIKKMVDFSASSNYLVIGIHTSSKANRSDLEKLMVKEFGARYINLREYLATYGLEDAGLTPTETDITAMSAGICPPQLLSDGVHFTYAGSTLLAKLIYRRSLALGIVN